MQSLYAKEISNTSDEILISTILSSLKENKLDYEFALLLFSQTQKNIIEIDELIKKHIENWDMKKILIIDKSILRMAACEILFFSEIPVKVSINEAIEIAKKFSNDTSGKFINGILDAIRIDLEKNGKLLKSGRGLITSSLKKNSN